jgi:hypothetical protein
MNFSVLCSFWNKWNNPFFDFSFSFVEKLKWTVIWFWNNFKKTRNGGYRFLSKFFIFFFFWLVFKDWQPTWMKIWSSRYVIRVLKIQYQVIILKIKN